MKSYSSKFKIKGFTFLAVVLSFALFALRFTTPTLAAKPRVWKTSTTVTTTTATKPSYSVKLRADRRAVNINFYNAGLAEKVSYELTYLGNDIEQGVVGSVLANEGSSAFRLLLFGTCSKNVCTYHKNISDARLKITAKLSSGKTLIKKYKIRV